MPVERIMKKYCFLILLLFGSGAIAAQELVLEKVIIVSRHGVRAPLDGYLNTLDEITGDGYQWTRWTVPGSHLTLRGGALEMLFGEYFRLWLIENKFDVDNLKRSDVYFGASSKQRTIATARAFAAGMLPLMIVPIDYKLKADSTIGFLDPDYLPLLNNTSTLDGYFDTIAFKEEAYRELGQLRAPSYIFLEQVLRMGHSPYAHKRGINHFNDFVGVCLNFYNEKDERLEPTMIGGLKDANMASDAFILQYYEMEDAEFAAFGNKLSFNDWIALASIKDDYGHILFSKAPIISVNVSHCMLKRIQAEMSDGGHKFAFFCSHDSMIEALLAAMRVNSTYELPGTIERKTPIGVKLVFEQWKERSCLNSPKYVRIRLIYQSSEQIREMKVLDIENPPMSFDLDFNGLEKTNNGMYRYEDFMNRLQTSIDAYNATAHGRNPWE